MQGATHVQNILESTALTLALLSADSKIHLVVPSCSTVDHHLKPTSFRPDTFFTVQKSALKKSTQTTNWRTKFDRKIPVGDQQRANYVCVCV